MDPKTRDRLVARIVSGVIRVRTPIGVYYVGTPSPRMSYLAEELYHERVEQSRFGETYSDDEIVELLVDTGQWTETTERHFNTIPDDIEKLKIGLYRAAFRSDEQASIRKALKKAKSLLSDASAIRHSLDHLTPDGAATLAKNRFLVGMGLQSESGKRLFTSPQDFFKYAGDVVDVVITEIIRNRITEEQYRELARKEPWRPIWNLATIEHSLFGVPPTKYTDEQRVLCSWSSLYDSVFKHPKCPPDSVVEEDDALDGWLILQKQERDRANSTQAADELIGNEKIRNSSEVFMVARNREDAARVMGLNDDSSRSTLRQRLGHVSKHGVVREDQMPDTRLNLRMQLAKMQSDAMKRK